MDTMVLLLLIILTLGVFAGYCKFCKNSADIMLSFNADVCPD